MAEVVEINDVEALESYRLCWAALLNETPHASFFQSLDWLQVFWKHFGSGQHLRTLIVFSGGQPIGILPLASRNERTPIGQLAVLTYPLHDWGSFFGPIGPNPTATLFAGFRHIRHTEQDWDLFEPRGVNAAECDRGRTETAMQVAELRPRKQTWKTTWMIDIADTWEAYLRGRDAELSELLRRSERLAAAAGELTFERYRPRGKAYGDAEARWDLFSQCLDINARRQEVPKNTKTLGHESSLAFLRDAHRTAAEQGALDVCLLRLDGLPIAYSYNYQRDGRIEVLCIGLHPSFASLRPETLLMRSMIRDSIERRDLSLSLGDGHSLGTQQWATRRLASLRYTHYARSSAKAQLLRAKHWWDARRTSDAADLKAIL